MVAWCCLRISEPGAEGESERARTGEVLRKYR